MARPAVSESIAALKLQQSINGELSSDAHTEGKHGFISFESFVYLFFYKYLVHLLNNLSSHLLLVDQRVTLYQWSAIRQ